MEQTASYLQPSTPASLDLGAMLACTECRARLKQNKDGMVCSACAHEYPCRNGFVDLTPPGLRQLGVGQAFMETEAGVRRYESRARPAFLRIMGANWGGTFTSDDEDRYLREHLSGTRGPVLDLACGSGRWTKTVAETVGASRVIGLDLSFAMLRAAYRVLPNLLLMRGSATQLPFANRSFGAINISNALQVIPSPRQVIQEVGRCLEEGGTFTCFTFRRASNVFYRMFQWAFSRIVGVQAFREADIRQWIESAGMELVDVSGPRLILLFTARRRASA